MKYLLILQVKAAVLEQLTTEQRAAVNAGHREFQRVASDAGELISTQSLADPSTSTVLHSRGVSSGPFHAVGEYMGGYYLVDVDSRERALELANLLPDVQIDGLAVEVRPVMCGSGADL
ncbi:YciI family protein [Kribbella catacumbae]|uniref:YciI family protein n=1 Tax=Kribbella catacumbae TaxID=460086 RepID=UPI00036FDB8E|nr:YciI family protein [Kribbella catacumbae]